MAIKPISLPSGAGVEFGKGDVRHFSEGDSVGVPELQGPTRHLAERDNQIAKKLNDVIDVVNNKEQFVPVSIPRTFVGAGTEEIISNYKIPTGFESRVLSASVASTPISSFVQLNIYYAQGYGNTTGNAVVSTSGDFTGGVQFYSNGEFIVAIKNTGPIAVEIVGSILLTMRPIGEDTDSLLVGSVLKGDTGKPGGKGDKGEKGDPGAGGSGTPGMVWKDAWQTSTGYSAPTDVVSFPLYGTVISSYIAKQSHVSNSGNQPPNTAFWSPVAVGSTGSVSSTVTTISTTSGSIPNYLAHTVQATLATAADWQGVAINGYDASGYSAGSTSYFLVSEAFIESSVNNPGFQRGMAFLTGLLRIAFKGNGTITLPKTTNGARLNYSTSFVGAVASVNGTIPNLQIDATGSISKLVTIVPTASDQFTLKSLNASPIMTEVSIFGVQPY